MYLFEVAFQDGSTVQKQGNSPFDVHLACVKNHEGSPVTIKQV